LELTGQPYPPVSADHAVVRALAYRVRRLLGGSDSAEIVDVPTDLEGLVALVQRIEAAERRGDELVLARELPRALTGADGQHPGLSDAAAHRLERVRTDVHVTAADVMRRLGYRDLAWLLLHRVAPGRGESAEILAAEVRLLLDLGWPEYALARADRAQGGGVPRLLIALAHAMAGRIEQADELLDACAAEAISEGERARVGAARVAVAVEAGDFERSVMLTDVLDVDALEPADRVELAVGAASAFARVGDMGRAVDLMADAYGRSPLGVVLNPFARELLTVLPGRLDDQELASRLRGFASFASVRDGGVRGNLTVWEGRSF